MDLERAMQFIVDVQAQHAVAMEAHAAIMREHAAVLQQHAGLLRDLDVRLDTVTDLAGRLAQSGLQLAADVRSLRESQSASDDRLNALIAVVDRMARHNGKN